jgi:hypothetical protein
LLLLRCCCCCQPCLWDMHPSIHVTSAAEVPQDLHLTKRMFPLSQRCHRAGQLNAVCACDCSAGPRQLLQSTARPPRRLGGTLVHWQCTLVHGGIPGARLKLLREGCCGCGFSLLTTAMSRLCSALTAHCARQPGPRLWLGSVDGAPQCEPVGTERLLPTHAAWVVVAQ